MSIFKMQIKNTKTGATWWEECDRPDCAAEECHQAAEEIIQKFNDEPRGNPPRELLAVEYLCESAKPAPVEEYQFFDDQDAVLDFVYEEVTKLLEAESNSDEDFEVAAEADRKLADVETLFAQIRRSL